MNSRALARSVGPVALLVALSNVNAQTQILEPLGVSLTSYKPSGATSIQDLRSMQSALQRGVNFDGAGRMPSPLGWALNGSSLEAGMGAGRVGEVRFDTGSYAPMAVDIALPAPGFTWVVGRTFNHRQETSGSAHRDSNGPQGKNWSQTSMPEIVLHGRSRQRPVHAIRLQQRQSDQALGRPGWRRRRGQRRPGDHVHLWHYQGDQRRRFDDRHGPPALQGAVPRFQ